MLKTMAFEKGIPKKSWWGPRDDGGPEAKDLDPDQWLSVMIIC